MRVNISYWLQACSTAAVATILVLRVDYNWFANVCLDIMLLVIKPSCSFAFLGMRFRALGAS